MRGLILVLSILAIVASAHVAKAGLSSTPRETLAPADTAIVTDEATQETEDQIGLTKAKRRQVQRGLNRLGFDTQVNGKFDESTRAVIARWQEGHGYRTTGFTWRHKRAEPINDLETRGAHSRLVSTGPSAPIQAEAPLSYAHRTAAHELRTRPTRRNLRS